ncbi:uncharacterized protein PgNI_03430 [Pyricularia grisea]|uniref:Heme oxygenase-like protein n=1 Tax=Pyricularia grisea TaxID=148305 RepID=A0A6P8B9R7_PYRGI|nr:uncharacterized protein PgNI_03430 [Pyricularia grisea]TLD12588.1 hypothetical protein PgNI_03430 [Pyricularia grisea]
MALPDSSKEDANKGLGKKINASTRLVHRTLNKLILDRLPLALPPRAQNPSLYTSGILHIASIYIAFESLWRQILHSQPLDNDKPDDLFWTKMIPLGRVNHKQPTFPWPFSTKTKSSKRIRGLLADMYDAKLERTPRLVADIRALTGWSRDEVTAEVRAITTGDGALARMVRHMNESVCENPHVLLAYGWVMYMALFSGGRFMRATLENAVGDPDLPFWAANPGRIAPGQRQSVSGRTAIEDPGFAEHGGEHPSCVRVLEGDSGHRLPLDFLHFSTERDGEDLKEAFKSRIETVEASLTPAKLDDVVQEAMCIFESLIHIIEDLDRICGTPATTGVQPAEAKTDLGIWPEAARLGLLPNTTSGHFVGGGGVHSVCADVNAGKETTSQPNFSKSWSEIVASGRLRDSIAVSKERSAKATLKRKAATIGVGNKAKKHDRDAA